MRISGFIESLESREFPRATPAGLTASYFADSNLTVPLAKRVDASPHFRWSGQTFADGAKVIDGFSARWTATVHTRLAGDYTFLTRADDGVQVWVNGQEIINDWSNHTHPWNSGKITLAAGHNYDLKIEYHHAAGTSAGYLALLWKLHGGAGIVPRSALMPSEFVGATLPPVVSTVPPVDSGPVGVMGPYFPPSLIATQPPVSVPPVVNAPPPTVTPPVVIVPPVVVPPVVTPPVVTPPVVTIPPVVTPPTVTVPPVVVPPVVVPPVVVPPVVTPPSGSNNGGTVPTPPPVVIVIPSTGRTLTVGAQGVFASIASAVKMAQPGDTVLIKPGTYHESINLMTSGTASKPITIAAETAGTVTWDGSGFTQFLGSNFANTKYITVKGINFKNCANGADGAKGAVNTADGWRLEDVTVDGADGTGIEVWGDSITLLRVTAQNCGLAGLSAGGCSNVLVQDCKLFGNNTANHSTDNNGGAGKWTKTDHVTVDNLDSENNTGPGIWFDYNNTNVIIRNSTFKNNHDTPGASGIGGQGIKIELCPGPMLIENNNFSGNTGAVVGVQSSRNITIRNNQFSGSYVDLQDWPRGVDYTTQNISVYSNTFDGTKVYTSGGTWDAGSVAGKQILFAGNTYTNSPADLFTWGGTVYDLNGAKTKLTLETQAAPTTQPTTP